MNFIPAEPFSCCQRFAIIILIPCVFFSCDHLMMPWCVSVQALANVSTASVSKAPWPSDSMVQIASQLLEFKADPNARDCDGCAALHRAIQCGNAEVFNVLLSNDRCVYLRTPVYQPLSSLLKLFRGYFLHIAGYMLCEILVSL